MSDWKTELADILDNLGTREGRLSDRAMTLRNLDELVFQLRKPAPPQAAKGCDTTPPVSPATDAIGDAVIVLHLKPREDGGLRISSPTNPGLILDDGNPETACLRIWPALESLTLDEAAMRQEHQDILAEAYTRKGLISMAARVRGELPTDPALDAQYGAALAAMLEVERRANAT